MVRLDSTNSKKAFESFIIINNNKGSFLGSGNRGTLPSAIKIPQA